MGNLGPSDPGPHPQAAMPSRTTSGPSPRFLLRSFRDKFKRKVKGKPQETGQLLAWRTRVGDAPQRGPGSWALIKLRRLWKERCPHESPAWGHKPTVLVCSLQGWPRSWLVGTQTWVESPSSCVTTSKVPPLSNLSCLTVISSSPGLFFFFFLVRIR